MKPQAIKKSYITEFVNSGMSQQEADETFNRRLDGYIDKNGWCRAYFNYCDVIPHDKRKNSWRPISLRGIETNNNWTVILSEKDLPSADSKDSYEVCFDGKAKLFLLVDAETIIKYWKTTPLTHYKKYEPTPDPIF